MNVMNKSTLSVIAVLLMCAAVLIGGCGGGDKGDPGSTGGTKGEKTRETASGTALAIMECIPAGSPFYMTNSISKTIDSVEMFLIDIGVGPMLGIGVSRPGDAKPRDSVLMTMLKKTMKLGEGFDPKGAAAIVMVNPEAAGIDFIKQFEAARARSKAEGGGGEINYFKESRMMDLAVLVLPGTLETLFAGDKPTKDGRLSIISQRMGPGEKTYAAQKGSYVVIASSKIAVNAILDSKKSVAGDLSVDEMAMVKDSELTIHFAMGPYRPLFGALLDIAEKKLSKNFDKATAAGLGMYVAMGRGIMEQMDAATIGVKLGQNGVNIDSICTAKPGSAAAKIFQAESTTVGGAKVVDSLPSLPYVWAFGVDGWFDNPALHDSMMKLFESMMGPDSIYKIGDKSKARMMELQKDFAGMVTGMQVVIGAAPKGKGMFNLSYIIKCKDSAKYRAIFPESIEISNEMMAGLEMPPGAPKFAMTYTKDAEKVDGLSVDALNITLSGLPPADQEKLPEILKMALGEEGIRMLVATPDAKTLVMSLGGSVEALKETLKVAGGTGPIPKMPGTAMVMRNLPENSSVVSLLSASNLLELVREGMKIGKAPAKAIASIPTIKCKTPIAFGLRAKGSTLQTGLFVAKPLIKDIVQAVIKATVLMRPQSVEDSSGPTKVESGSALAKSDF